MENISKKLIGSIVMVIALVAGGLFWYASVQKKQAQMEQKQAEIKQQQAEAATKSEFDKRNKTLARSRITGVTDIEGEYKKVTINDGDVTFSFEVPDKWLTETRNSGEVEMNTEELREFFATNYDGDIKAKEVCNDVSVIDYSKDSTGVKRTDRMCGQPSGDYWDFTWDMLKDMPYEKMKKAFDSRRDEFSPGYPNASVSPNDAIWYNDVHNQIDFYILSKETDKKYYDDKSLGLENAKWSDVKEEYPSGSFKTVYISLSGFQKILSVRILVNTDESLKASIDRMLNTIRFE